MDKPTDEKTGRGGAVYLISVIAMALYVLGLGPAVRLTMFHPEFAPAISRIYAPVVWVNHHSPWSKKLIEGYVKLWISPPPQP